MTSPASQLVYRETAGADEFLKFVFPDGVLIKADRNGAGRVARIGLGHALQSAEHNFQAYRTRNASEALHLPCHGLGFLRSDGDASAGHGAGGSDAAKKIS